MRKMKFNYLVTEAHNEEVIGVMLKIDLTEKNQFKTRLTSMLSEHYIEEFPQLTKMYDDGIVDSYFPKFSLEIESEEWTSNQNINLQPVFIYD